MKCYAKNDWDELQAVALGYFMDPAIVTDVFDHSYFKPFIKYADRLAKETEEDLNEIQIKLESMGIKVIRPDFELTSEEQLKHSYRLKFNFDSSTSGMPQDMFMNEIPVPLAPRNEMMVYGDVIYHNAERPCYIDLNQFNNKKINASDLGWGMPHWPAVTRVDDTLIFGNEFDDSIIEQVMNHAPEHTKFITTDIDGHVDATLACIRDGLLLTTRHNPDSLYKTTFPGWDYISVGKNGYRNMCRQMSGHNNAAEDIISSIEQYGDGGWYLDGMEKDPDIEQVSDIVNNSLANWFGYSEETYFEVNCLTINPDLSMVIGESNEMEKELAKRGHEIINVQWRNRWFFDQGLHCLTQDLLRKK